MQTTTTTSPALCIPLATAFNPESPAIPIPNGGASPIDSTRLAIASAAAGSGQVRVGVVAGDDDVTFGAPVLLGAADDVRIATAGGRAFTVYSKPGGLFARALEISGTTVNLGAESQVAPGGSPPVQFDLLPMSSNLFVVLRGGSFARPVDVAADLALTTGAEVSLGPSDMAAGARIGPSELVLATSDSSGAVRVRAASVSGTALILGTPLDMPAQPATPIFVAVAMPVMVEAVAARAFILTVARGPNSSDAFVGAVSGAPGTVSVGSPASIPFVATDAVVQRAELGGDDTPTIVLIGAGGFASACIDSTGTGDVLVVLRGGRGGGARMTPFPTMSDDLRVVIEDGGGAARVGELERRELNETTPPPVVTTFPPVTVPPGAASFCVRDIAPWPFYSPGIDLTVTVECSLDPVSVSTYIVEETYPPGWAVVPGSVSAGGVDNGVSVRWFFLDNILRSLSYVLTPRVGVSGTVTVSGTLSVDGPGGLSVVRTAGPESLRGSIHPAEARPGKRPNFHIEIDDVLDYARAFLEDDDLRFPGISSPNRAPFVLRASVIWKTHFQGKYRDDSSAEPLDSDRQSERWREEPDD